MLTPKHKIFNNVKSINIFDAVILSASLATVVLSIFNDKEALLYVMPVIIITIICKYLFYYKKKCNVCYIIGLLAVIASDILAYLDFKKNFILITILTTLYEVGCIMAIKKFLNKGKLTILLSASALLAFTAFGYILFSILKHLVFTLPSNQWFFMFLCSFFMVVLLVLISIIHIKNAYYASIYLLISGIFFFCQMLLSSINEYLFYLKTITIVTLIFHIASMYFFMTFLIKMLKNKSEEKVYL